MNAATNLLRRLLHKPGGDPPRSVVAIRCLDSGPDVQRLAKQLRSAFPDHPVYYLPDQRFTKSSWPENSQVVPLDETRLTKNRLFHQRENVGWLCGDYCYYAMLDHDWDYLWLVEPDVAFLGTAAEILQKADESSVDLIATHIYPRPAEWPWAKRLSAVTRWATASGAFFPITRVSRPFAKRLLTVRQQISKRLQKDPEALVPNDESVVGTVALAEGYSVLDLAESYPEAFYRWGWVLRYHLDEVAQLANGPAFIHPGLLPEAYDEYVEDCWKSVFSESHDFYEKIIPILAHLTPTGQNLVLQRGFQSLATRQSQSTD